MRWGALLGGLLGLLALAPRADACRLIEIELLPSSDLQMVVWIEDAAGNFVDTVFITRSTGTYGLGNRPGRMDFNTSYRWPYGRRISTFPVWSHRHGTPYPEVIFQDDDEDDLSHKISESSTDSWYCRPLKPSEDDMRCLLSGATTSYTDKGKYSGSTSGYPPRNDLLGGSDKDSPDVALFASANNLDAVSRATPTGGLPFDIRLALTDDLPPGDYVAWVEVSKELDQNATYDFESPSVSWSEYGEAYRGQPSVLWSLPFEIGGQIETFTTTGYAGYGDPEGLDGVVRPPDATITEGIEGSGAGRLLVTPEGHRVRLTVRPVDDDVAPEAPTALEATEIGEAQVMLGFTAPGDTPADPPERVGEYEIRYLPGTELTDENFLAQGIEIPSGLDPEEPGVVQHFALHDLIPETRYWVGVRAKDACLNESELVVTSFVTPRATPPAVGACDCQIGAGGAIAWRGIVSVLVLLAFGLGGACARVKPWQREDLAKGAMITDRTIGEERFETHSRAAREGSVGGNGGAGGGCGCN